MKNKQVLPFERNRYYSGKMLSSSDFLMEQTYNNNKRRFMNQMMYGTGIVCGLNVYNLDDLSLMVESGVALDVYGREIVVENSVIKKLSAIPGFDDLETNTAALCIRYEEEPVHGIYAPTQEGSECEYNHVDETFALYLVDKEKLNTGFSVESEFLQKGELIHTNAYTLELSVPAVVCMGKYVKILLTLTKNSTEQADFSYKGTLQMPVFTLPDGGHEFEIQLEDHLLEQGESLVREIWVKAQNVPAEEAKILIKPDSASAFIDHEEIETDGNFLLTLVVADINPRELVDRELGKTSLEMRNMGGQDDIVRLADIVFTKNDSSCVIQEVEEKRIKRYIEVPSDGAVRNEYLGYYAMYGPKEKTDRAALPSLKKENKEQDNNRFSGGYFEIPLGKGAKKGEVFYSGEIVHSLGTGEVYVEVGCEAMETDESVGREVRTVVYGASGIFRSFSEIPAVECAVKILPDKGTFIAGVRFLKEYHAPILKCRWGAVKTGEVSDTPVKNAMGSRYITTEKPTIVLAPGETCFFPVKFVNMESCHLYYELMESGSGEISEDGVYRAPQKEGVYEIHIFCANDPLICTYAYAVVKENRE